MPHLITREQAVDTLGQEEGCFICRLAAGHARYVLERSNGISVFLSRYPRFWGQLMIAPDAHAETFTELDEKTWMTMNTLAHKAARLLEQTLSPARCYVASTGSPQHLPMTCPHIHINIIPVPDKQLKPAEVFTWKNGLYDGTEAEWEELFALLQRSWSR